MLLFLSHVLDFHSVDSVSIAFHRRHGRGETSVHASNLIRLGEIYICYRQRIPLFKVVVSLSSLPDLSSNSLPIHYVFLRPRAGIIRIYKRSCWQQRNAQTAGYSAIRIPDFRWAPLFICHPVHQLRPEARWILRDVHYWSIFGVKRAHPEITALFVGGFTTGSGTSASFRSKNHQDIPCANTATMIWKIVIPRDQS